MAWIELSDYPRTIIWVDGERPDLEELRRIDRQYTRSECENPDTLLESLITEIKRKYCYEFLEPHSFNNCDHFCFEFQAQPVLQPEWNDFYEDLKRGQSKGNDYRQLVFSLDDQACPKGKECVRNVINTLGFRVMPKGAYKNYTSFENSCRKILDEIYEIYVAPCSRTEKLMKSMGFNPKY